MRIPNLLEISSAIKGAAARPFAVMEDHTKKKAYIERHPGRLRYLRERAEGYRNRPIPALRFGDYREFDTNGSRDAFQEEYFDRRKRLNVMCMAYHFWGEGWCLQEAEDVIWAICGEFSWCLPAHFGGRSLECIREPQKARVRDGKVWSYEVSQGHCLDLFACETARELAEALRILGDAAAPLVRQWAVEEITERVFSPYLSFNAAFHFEVDQSNWSSVCGSSIGMAALYLIEEPMLLAPVLQRVISDLDVFLSSYGEDGIGLEGVGYWHYGFYNLVCFADMLKERSSGRLDLFREEKVRKVAFFPAAAYLYRDTCVNFSDCQAKSPCQRELLYYLKNVYPDMPVPTALAAEDTAPEAMKQVLSLREIYWSGPELTGEPFLERTEYEPDAQWLISCSRLCGRAVSFVIKGGSNAEPHNHNDLGQFMIYLEDTPLLCDLGGGHYTKDYFGAGRYDYLVTSSRGHSVPLIEGKEQKAGKDSRAAILGVDISEGGQAKICMELSSAYEVPSLQSFVRRAAVSWEKGTIRISDSFAFSSERLQVTERFITLLKPEFKKDAVWLRAGDSVLQIHQKAEQGEIILHQEKYAAADGTRTTAWLIDFACILEQGAAEIETEILVKNSAGEG